jgi:hypothetical protein
MGVPLAVMGAKVADLGQFCNTYFFPKKGCPTPAPLAVRRRVIFLLSETFYWDSQ